MAGSTFQTNPVYLHKLLEDCHSGALQLPDFQRSWVWDEERIKSLIASVSRAFPVGALMTLKTGGEVNFRPRPVEGAPDAAGQALPQALLLDGQQRMTSLYQVALRGQVVQTVTPRNKRVQRWFYLDIRKALDPSVDRDEAVVGVPADKLVRSVELDLSTPDKEYATLMYPVSQVLDWDRWQDGFDAYWEGAANKPLRELFRTFKREVLENFRYYQVPVIALDQSTSKEAVCVVFEKVNTGGKPLDAFELVTAMYAMDGHELRKDWYGSAHDKGRHRRLVQTLCPPGQEAGILANVSNTDFLHIVSLFHTRALRRQAAAAGKQGRELPAVSGNRQALLNLPLEAYKQYETQAEQGLERAAKFLHLLRIYRVYDLPYQTQIVPLAAILADLGDAWEHDSHRARLQRWYWCGVFGELYGSAVESRSAKDFLQVPEWLLRGGPEPATVSEVIFRADRLKTMRMRLSAAYKGMNALLMNEGAQDWRSGQKFDHTVFFGENVDIHHIFPKAWCQQQGIAPALYDAIINKTPLSFRTNRIIGGVAPSQYLAQLQAGDGQTPGVAVERLDGYLRSHALDPALLRADDVTAFWADRQQRLLALIAQAMGKTPQADVAGEEGADLFGDTDEGEAEAEMVIAM